MQTTFTSHAATLTAFILLALLGVALWLALRKPPQFAHDEFEDSGPVVGNDSMSRDEYEARCGGVWAMQEHIMRSSSQHVPNYPALTETSLLYWALIAEEFAELSVTMEHLLDKHAAERAGVNDLRRAIAEAGGEARLASTNVRNMLASFGVMSVALDEDDAVSLLDDLTDITVVTAGAVVACRLPGDAGYDEVFTSNLSKADPDSGRIERTSDGKWIKGRNYRKPDLHRVMREFMGTE